MSEHLKVGVGRSDITPPVGMWLAGYSPVRQAESIHDRLHVTSFCIASGETRAMLAVAEVVSIPTDLSLELRQQICEMTGVPAENIILSATHTHSGPAVRRVIGGTMEPIEEYVRTVFRPAVLEAAKAAASGLRPAQMGIGVTHSDVGINRRQMKEDGGIKLGQEPLAPYDPDMTVISFREPDGTPIANLIHYGCHNTGAGKNTEITRDWSGVAIDRLEAESGAVTAYFNSSEGDVGPRLTNGRTTGNLQLALELGGIAAADAMRAWKSIREWKDVSLRTMQGSVKLPYEPFSTLEEVDRSIAELGDPANLKGLQNRHYANLTERREMILRGEKAPEAKLIPECILALGPVAFYPMPFEMFTQVQVRIKRHSPFPYTVCIGLANGGNGYFPTQDQLCRGGYEVTMFRTMTIPFVENADQCYVEGSLKLLRELYEKKN